MFVALKFNFIIQNPMDFLNLKNMDKKNPLSKACFLNLEISSVNHMKCPSALFRHFTVLHYCR